MQWQPIETAPKDGTQILVWVSRSGYVPFYALAFYYPEKRQWYMNGNSMDYEPNYWMPLPPSPQAP